MVAENMPREFPGNSKEVTGMAHIATTKMVNAPTYGSPDHSGAQEVKCRFSFIASM